MILCKLMKLFHFISKLLWKQLWQYNRRQCFVADILLCVKLCFSLALNTIAQRKELFQFCSSSKNFKMQFQSNTHEAWNNCMKYHREEQYFNSDFQKGEGQCGASGVWWNGDSGKNGDHLSWKGPSLCIKCEPVNSAECCVVLSPARQILSISAHPRLCGQCQGASPSSSSNLSTSLNSWLVMPTLPGGRNFFWKMSHVTLF